MDRNFLFGFTAVIIILILLNAVSMNSVVTHAGRITDLENLMLRYVNEITRLENKSSISCKESFFRSPSGTAYLKLSASGNSEGKIFLHAENVHHDPLFVINIREVSLLYDRKEKRLATDADTAPTFRDVSSGGSCGASLDPGDSVTCVLDSYYSGVILETLEEGNNAFVIKYLAAEIDMDPYYFVASDLCVTLQE